MAEILATWTLFDGERRVVGGPPPEVAAAAHTVAGRDHDGPLLVFDDVSGKVVDLDLRGSAEEVAERYTLKPPLRPRGRPKLGVVAREVTLLPRHWEWLNAQPGGASVALRKLVEQARRAGDDGRKARQEAAYRFMASMAGDLAGYEEAIRALFADDRAAFDAQVKRWPRDVAGHAAKLGWGSV
jgi:hypothetical protein